MSGNVILVFWLLAFVAGGVFVFLLSKASAAVSSDGVLYCIEEGYTVYIENNVVDKVPDDWASWNYVIDHEKKELYFTEKLV